MPITNYTEKEVQFKIVLYGPPFGGKSETLNYLHANLDAQSKSDISTLKSAADKTLVFEFVPQEATLLDEFKIRFEVYTVTGNVQFNAPRKLVLRDADGIIFTADSEWANIEENVQSFKNLEENMKKLGIIIDDVPIVLQYNKRASQDVAPVNYLDFVLNNHKMRMPTFETDASTGSGIFTAFRALSNMVIQRFLETSPGYSGSSPLGMMVEG